MGLFGPSWSWEEIQRKDALMGELKKENDRVLKEQRKMIRQNIDNYAPDSYNPSENASGGGYF